MVELGAGASPAVALAALRAGAARVVATDGSPAALALLEANLAANAGCAGVCVGAPTMYRAGVGLDLPYPYQETD